uniref:DNA polymerase III subunit gamma/tau n=1 Tax=Candidatus Ventrenecus sp. TaxID=3085654 RepID=UPI003FEE1F69
MNYKVLYRKYRPDKFENIIGQDYSIQMLKNSIIHNKISHAYLFTGPRGTGKTSTAKVFAKTINCLNPINGEACGKCAACLAFSTSPDIIEIDAASNNGVDDIRELINNVKIAPSEGKYKIYIIDEVHMMTTSAFNALLLTLEEPPAHAVFIMATTNVENVPITILSRCQRFNFQKISLENLKKQISKICDLEKIKITEEAIEEIAYLSEGGLRDALSLLDQLSSNEEEITAEKILENYGSISSKFVKDLLKELSEGDVSSVIEKIQELENTSSDYKIFIKKVVQELAHIAVLIKVNNYQGLFSFQQVKKLIFELNDVLNKININVNPYELIEIILLNVISTEENEKEVVRESKIIKTNSISNAEKLANKDTENVILEKKEDKITEEVIGNNDNNGSIYINELKKIRVNNCFTDAKRESLISNQAIWNQKKNDTNVDKRILGLIVDSQLVASSLNHAIVTTKLASMATLINNQLDEIENSLNLEFHIIALSMEEWTTEKNEYIQNIKNKYVYNYIDEETIADLKPKKASNDFEEITTNIFNSDKIEIV